MKILLLALLVLVLSIVVVVVWGALLPAEHTATREARLPAPPERVFALLTDVAAYPTWRADVRAVEVEGTQPLRFRGTSRHGDILFEEVERRPPERLVVRVADPDLPFGGRWTYTLAPDAEGTLLSIREDGVVRNPLFRFVSRYVLGHTATLDATLRAVRERLARPGAPSEG